jgi:hypothetical protein
VSYSDWQDHGDHDDSGYLDHYNHTDSDCVYTDWDDHADGGHQDYTDHDNTGAHSDWDDHDDHDDGAHGDWDDAHMDWTDEHVDWDDAHSDWGDHSDAEHSNHSDHDDTGHLDWDDAHSDWGDAHVDWSDAHSDWDNHSDAGSPHLDWTDGGDHLNWSDAHSDWGDYDDEGGPHTDWTNHSDAGDPHLDWTDDYTDWNDHDDSEHADYDVHADAGDPHIDWSDGDPHSDWTDQPHIDWTDHDDYPDHDDSGFHGDWSDHFNDAHTDWDDYSDGGVPPGKTRVTAIIGGYDVSCYVIGADIWRDALNAVGRWQLILDNQGHWWGGAFAVDDDVTIRINGSLMMMGYVDDIFPYLDSKGEYTEYIRVNGRDYGMDLAQLYITQEYVNTDAKVIVQNALGLAGSEIAYAAFPPVAGPIDYEFDRTYLADGFRDIAKLVDYDLYVQDNAARDLHFFDIATMGGGTEHTTVDLESVAGAATNNILRLEIGENIGFDIKNVIEAHAGELRDHWTDLNAADWITGVGTTTITNDFAFFVSGKSAIRMTSGAAATNLYMDLTFPRYSYTTSLDMSEPNVGRYAAYPNYAASPNYPIRIRLRDTAGNWIEYYSITVLNQPPPHETTDNTRNQEWRYIEFAYGDGTEIRPVASFVHRTWRFIGAAVAFDWSQVDTIRFIASPLLLRANGDFCVIDELIIPAIEVISIQTDPAPIGGTRMKDFYRPDIKNQVELDIYAANQLLKYSDPIQSVKITAIGQVDSNYAAQSLDVLAPSSGIIPVAPATHVPYRIFTLHHSVKLSPLNNEIVGYDYITEYELVRSIQSDTSADQLIAPTRVAITHSPTRALMRQFREQQRYRQPSPNLP